MRNLGKTHAQILEIKKDLESGTPCWVYEMKKPTDYINRLDDLGVKVVTKKVGKDCWKFVLDDSVI